MEYKKEILVKDYFEIHNFYSNIYGKDRTIIVMQVGSFHECYYTNDSGLNLPSIADKLDIICTKKNNKEPISQKNWGMCGIPSYITYNYIQKLCDLNFTVVKIDQVSDPPKPERKVVGIYSPATNINKISDKVNYIVSIVIEKNINLLCFGLVSYDLVTGRGTYYETSSTSDDLMLGLDETMRYLETCPPKEIILYYTIDEEEEFNNMKLIDILKYLELNDKIIFNYKQNGYGKKNAKISFQKLLFENIFKNTTNVFEFLNLELYNMARLALTNLLEYTQNHQYNLVEKLKPPELFTNNNSLFIGNNGLYQLNIFNKNVSDKSLFNIINFTKTLL